MQIIALPARIVKQIVQTCARAKDLPQIRRAVFALARRKQTPFHAGFVHPKMCIRDRMEGVALEGEGKVLLSGTPDQAALREERGYRAENVAGLVE